MSSDLTWVVCGTVLPSFLDFLGLGPRMSGGWPCAGSCVDRPGCAQGAHDADADGRWAGDLAGRDRAAGGRAVDPVAVGCGRPAGRLAGSGGFRPSPHRTWPGLAARSPALWVLLGGGTLLMLVGLVDDRLGTRLAGPTGDSELCGDGLRALAGLAAHRLHRCAVDHLGVVGDLDRRPHQLVQHAGQHGRLVGRRGGDRRDDVGRRAARDAGWRRRVSRSCSWPAFCW